jgi:CRISPR-associated protein Cas1
MIKRIIDISSEPCHVSVRLGQLVIQPRDADKSRARSIPCEDIAAVVLDHGQVTVTQAALAALGEACAPVIVTGPNHLPAGVFLPVSNNTEVVWRVKEQVGLGEPARKRLWQQVVSEKIRNQALAVSRQSQARGFLLELAGKVKTDDRLNDEGYAARIYWSAWLQNRGTAFHDEEGQLIKFLRDTEGTDPLNFMLNYGYAILRAGVARALVSAGLYPVLALKHGNRSNSFALADDLMEPLRPMVDRRVRRLYATGSRTLDSRVKAGLLSVLYDNVGFAETTGPLMVALHRYTAAYIRCLQGKEKKLLFPRPLELGDEELSAPAVNDWTGPAGVPANQHWRSEMRAE